MKTRINCLIGMLLLLFIQCVGSKKVSYEFQTKVPFQILKAEYKDWIGGVEGVRGTVIEILINDQDIGIDTLYFRNNKIIPNVKKLNKTDLLITGSIINKSKPMLILHKDSSKEFGNEAPTINKSVPFDLMKNQVVLRYTHKNKIEYVKIELKKEETLFYQ